jgi:hypothetical protein
LYVLGSFSSMEYPSGLWTCGRWRRRRRNLSFANIKSSLLFVAWIPEPSCHLSRRHVNRNPITLPTPVKILEIEGTTWPMRIGTASKRPSKVSVAQKFWKYIFCGSLHCGLQYSTIGSRSDVLRDAFVAVKRVLRPGLADLTEMKGDRA